MQSVVQLIVSGFSGTVLVLASCVMVAPLLAVFVAAGCVGAAWAMMRLASVECGAGTSRTGERAACDRRSALR